MKKEYQQWISENITETFGKCKEATIEMQKAFPELKIVKGHYYCAVWGERMHFWLIDGSDEIIDPTKDQFPSKGLGVYEKLDESLPQPTGKCPNCGNYCYDNKYLCSITCETEYSSYLNIPIKRVR